MDPTPLSWIDRIAATDGWKHPYDLMPRAYPELSDLGKDRDRQHIEDLLQSAE